MFVEQGGVAEFLEQKSICEEFDGVKYWKCSLCHMNHNRKQDLLRHIESLHIQTDPYYCLYCQSSVQFKTKRFLQRHLSSSHKGQYSWSHCFVLFKSDARAQNIYFQRSPLLYSNLPPNRIVNKEVSEHFVWLRLDWGKSSADVLSGPT